MANRPLPDVSLFALRDIPLIRPDHDLARELLQAVNRAALELMAGDIFAVAQKIVSKAEGREVLLSEVVPSTEAKRLARATDKDPRLVELILEESQAIVRQRRGALIMRHRLGFVQAHAGIDQSNIDHSLGERALLLPRDPDASAARIRAAIGNCTGVTVGVIIVDSMSRPWRLGTTGAAIGCAGVRVFDDRRGTADLFGRELEVTIMNRVDNIAAAANLVMGESVEGIPAVLIRGLPAEETDSTARDIIRPLAQDLFR